jgi:hypothetical protein
METANLSILIEAALLRGATRAIVDAELQKVSAESGTPMPTREEVDAAYASCVERWIVDAEQDPGGIYAYHVRLRKHLYQKSYVLNDFKTCLAIAADLAKLQNQYAAKIQERKPARSTRPFGKLTDIRSIKNARS